MGLSWPLDTAGLIKGPGLGYTGGATAQRAVSHSGAGHQLGGGSWILGGFWGVGVELGFELGSWGMQRKPRHVRAVAQHDRWPAIGSSSIAAVAAKGGASL